LVSHKAHFNTVSVVFVFRGRTKFVSPAAISIVTTVIAANYRNSFDDNGEKFSPMTPVTGVFTKKADAGKESEYSARREP
jgi:hypothetical protein